MQKDVKNVKMRYKMTQKKNQKITRGRCEKKKQTNEKCNKQTVKK